MHGVDRAAGGSGGSGGKEGGVDHPEAHLLALQVADALVERQSGERGIWAGLGSVGGENAGQEQDGHRPEYRPSLPLFARHAAKGVGQPGGDAENEQDFQEIGHPVGILERVRAVRVEEATAVGPEFLDHFLRARGSHGDDLPGPFQAGDVQVGAEVLDDPLGDQHQTEDDTDRQEQVHD